MQNFEFPFRADVQGLRGLAVLLVVLYHCGLPLTGGFVGVDVFFVISGFVITGGLLKALSRDDFSLKRFFGRRVKRLLPALSLMVTATLLAAPWLSPVVSQWRSAQTGLAATFISANAYLFSAGGYFEGDAEQNPFLHTWSLSVEEQFYLVFPALLAGLCWFGRRRERTHQTLFIGVSVVFMTSLAACLLAAELRSLAGVDWLRLSFFGSPTRAWEFAIGALVALASVPNSPKWLGPAGLAMIVVPSFVYSKTTVFPGYAALWPVLGTALVLTQPGVLKRLFSHPWMTRLGDVSYAWYLWHWPLLVFSRATFPAQFWAVPAAVVFSLVLAFVSYRWVEEPVRKSRLSATWVGAACVFISCAAWYANGVVLSDENGKSMAAGLVAENRPKPALCAKGGGLDDPDCRFGTQGPRVVLVGDSNAAQHLPALRQLADHGSIQLTVSTLLGCPFMEIRHWRDGQEHRRCHTWVKDTTQALLREKPDVVVLGLATDAYLDQPRFELFHPVRGRQRDADAKAEAANRGLNQTISALQSAGIRVVLVDPIPKFVMTGSNVTVGGACSVLGVRLFPEVCAPTRRLDEVWLNAKKAKTVHRRSSADLVLDLGPEICPSGACRMWDKDWLYHDGTHLSSAGSLRTVQAFHRAILGER